MELNTSNTQFMRRWRLLVSSKDQQIDVYDSGTRTQATRMGRALAIEDLRIVFVCEKAASETPNYSVITVYNMADADIDSVAVGDTVVLEAGYENGNYGMIFTGQIVQPYVTRESNTDTALNLVVQDGDQFLNQQFVMTTLAAASTLGDVAAACLTGDLPVTPGFITQALSAENLIRGKVLFGSAAYYLQKAASCVDAQFYIEDGAANIVAASDVAVNQAVELNPRTGLVDMPGQTDDGVKGKCLINPSIKLNTLIHIDSLLVAPSQVEEGKTAYTAVSTDGVYKVVKLTYRGDTHGDEWYCEFEAVSQPGLTPAAMTGDVTGSWR